MVGTGSEVVAMTLETKPQRKNQRTILCHMAGLQLGGHMVRAPGRVVPGLLIHGLREARLVEQGCVVLFTHSWVLSMSPLFL